MRRVAVVGTSGSGKTTLARHLARRLDVPHVELDALHWEPNWTEAPREVLRERVSRALEGDAWVVDGNYSIVRDIVWTRADSVVWLDYSLPVIMWRLLLRTVRRIINREPLWNENRESLKMALSRKSILLWALQTYQENRTKYPAEIARHPHLQSYRLRHPREADALIHGGHAPRASKATPRENWLRPS